MSKDMMQDKLNQLREAAKQRWGAFTDRDLALVDEKSDKLLDLLQTRYGHTREQAQKEVTLFLSSLNPEVKNPVEVVRETLSDSTPEEEAHVAKRVYKE